jgi:hypothetical protein
MNLYLILILKQFFCTQLRPLSHKDLAIWLFLNKKKHPTDLLNGDRLAESK